MEEARLWTCLPQSRPFMKASWNNKYDKESPEISDKNGITFLSKRPAAPHFPDICGILFRDKMVHFLRLNIWCFLCSVSVKYGLIRFANVNRVYHSPCLLMARAFSGRRWQASTGIFGRGKKSCIIGQVCKKTQPGSVPLGNGQLIAVPAYCLWGCVKFSPERDRTSDRCTRAISSWLEPCSSCNNNTSALMAVDMNQYIIWSCSAAWPISGAGVVRIMMHNSTPPHTQKYPDLPDQCVQPLCHQHRLTTCCQI